MNRIHHASRPKLGAALLAAASIVMTMAAPAFGALPDTSDPSLELDRTIRTTPFTGTSVSMRDNEGSAYVPSDDSLWLADDNGKAVYEASPSGTWKRTITRAVFNAAEQLGGGPPAGTTRTNDFESIAYDAQNDVLYVFSGPCCDSSILPTAFRLIRDGSGAFQVESYQPLVSTADYTGAAWNPADGKVYVGRAQQLRTYDYVTNTQGSTFSIPDVSGITGLDFTPDGADLLVTTNAERLMRVRWSTKALVTGWNFDLRPFDMLDSRAVSLIGDQFFVSDGAGRTTGDPLRLAVFVFNVLGSGPVAPVASFNANPTSGTAPLTVSFTDTSSGSPETWAWDFDSNGTVDSTQRNPSHIYDTPGTYTVSLMVTNTAGSDVATRQIEVTSEPPPPPPSGNLVGNPGFEIDTAGWSAAGSGSGVTLTRITPGRNGSAGAAQLLNGATGNRKCVLNDDPNWVASTTAGTYTASVWVRDDTAGATIKIKVFERNGSTLVKARARTFTLTTGWTQISVAHAILSPGSTLDLQVFVPRASAPAGGTCFYADDASITRA